MQRADACGGLSAQLASMPYLVCNIVDDDNTVCSSVVTGSDGSEAFLACCIPNLELDCLAFEVERADLEIHSDCRDVGCESEMPSSAMCDTVPIMTVGSQSV